MKVITAVESISICNNPNVFLGGGICNCPDWQNEVIAKLESHNNAVLYNPRRKVYDMSDDLAAKEQIAWEFEAIENSDIFTMWFSNANSDQPICMYELGRQLAIREHLNELDTIVIGVEPGYRRELDVYTQINQVSSALYGRITNNLQDHVDNILTAIKHIS
jgi:hypothetical protein